MAVIVSDTFDRIDGPLGTADTGQSWLVISGDWAVIAHTAERSNVTKVSGVAVIQTGFTDAVTKVELVNPSSISFGAGNMGIVVRYFDSSHYFSLTYDRFPGANRVRLKRTYGGTATVVDVSATLADHDTISCAYCGSLFEIFINDVPQGTYDDSGQPQLYGTQSGLIGFQGVLGSGGNNNFDNFLVTTNGTCTPTYNCDVGTCVDPGDGSGTYPSLAACLEGCEVPVSYNCEDNSCVDPGDGSGEFASLAECVDSGCGATSQNVATQRFDAGTGSSYYLVPAIVDSGDELRSKCVKPGRVTSRRTNQTIQVYGYDVDSEISVSDLEDGQNSSTGALPLADNANVSQSPLIGVNVPNATSHTIRVAGDDTGETTRDRIDEIIYQVAQHGVRR